MDSAAVRCVEENGTVKKPLDTDAPFYLLVEAAGSNQDHDQEKMETFLQDCIEAQDCIDGVVASSGEQRKHFWELRETITPSLTKGQFTLCEILKIYKKCTI